MTPRQRILNALDHQPPDRTPVDGWFHPEVVVALKRHFQTDDWATVLEHLGIDGWTELAPSIHFAEFDAKAGPRPGHRAGDRAVWIDESTYEDGWGIRFRLGRSDRYQRWLSGPLQSAETSDDVLRYRFPSPDDVRQPPDYANQVAALKAEGRFVTGEIDNPYKRFWHLRDRTADLSAPCWGETPDLVLQTIAGLDGGRQDPAPSPAAEAPGVEQAAGWILRAALTRPAELYPRYAVALRAISALSPRRAAALVRTIGI